MEKAKAKKRTVQIKRNASLAHMSVDQYKKWRDKERLHVWTKKRRQDPAYRKQCAERQKARHDQLVADAEFGRLCRAFLANVGNMLTEWANLKHLALAGAADDAEGK